MPTVFDLPHVPPGVQVQADTANASRQIAAFLAKHPGLLEVLAEGLWYLHQAFPESDRFTIALEADRESPDWEYAVVCVQTALPVEEAHRRLDTFTRAWLLEHTAQLGDALLFDVEYV
jgi:hypothetical protein